MYVLPFLQAHNLENKLAEQQLWIIMLQIAW